ncbi:hypothetical protein SprV_0702312400 [Sparganum proliferum]
MQSCRQLRVTAGRELTGGGGVTVSVETAGVLPSHYRRPPSCNFPYRSHLSVYVGTIIGPPLQLPTALRSPRVNPCLNNRVSVALPSRQTSL